MRNIPCVICQVSDETFLFEKDGYKLVQCNRCGLAYIDPQPEPAELDEYYRDYGQLYISTPRKIRSKFRDARRELRRIRRLTGTPKPRMLDVGCSSGYIVRTALDAGWLADGVEPSEHSVKFARENFNLDLLQGDIFHPGIKTNHYQMITMYDVLEHNLDPVASLKRAYELLTDDGLLLLGVPDFGHRKARKGRQNWCNFIPPEHLFYFSEETLKKACEIAGFKFHKKLLRSPFRDSLKTVYVKNR